MEEACLASSLTGSVLSNPRRYLGKTRGGERHARKVDISKFRICARRLFRKTYAHYGSFSSI